MGGDIGGVIITLIVSTVGGTMAATVMSLTPPAWSALPSVPAEENIDAAPLPPVSRAAVDSALAKSGIETRMATLTLADVTLTSTLSEETLQALATTSAIATTIVAL